MVWSVDLIDKDINRIKIYLRVHMYHVKNRKSLRPMQVFFKVSHLVEYPPQFNKSYNHFVTIFPTAYFIYLITMMIPYVVYIELKPLMLTWMVYILREKELTQFRLLSYISQHTTRGSQVFGTSRRKQAMWALQYIVFLLPLVDVSGKFSVNMPQYTVPCRYNAVNFLS